MLAVTDVLGTVGPQINDLVAQLFIVVITAVIGFVGNEARKLLKSHASNDQIDFLTKLASVAVSAAEQVYDANDGPAKKSYALGVVEAELKKKGVTVDAKSIDAAIEAAVKDQFDWDTPAEEPVLDVSPPVDDTAPVEVVNPDEPVDDSFPEEPKP